MSDGQRDELQDVSDFVVYDVEDEQVQVFLRAVGEFKSLKQIGYDASKRRPK